jgi:LmbE family N-acetylglucosaminyl deacetylase
MGDTLKLLAILAHPDDESLGFGGILAKSAAEQVETHLVTATRGERGWNAESGKYPGVAALGKVREAELRAAAQVLGVRDVELLGYIDGELDQAHPSEAVAKIVKHLRRVQPHVVVTFGPDGCYGHPDHIAISQFTTAAILEAANPHSSYARHLAPHVVAKLYYMAPSKDLLDAYQSAFGELAMRIDGEDRRAAAWPDWQMTTRIDASEQWRTVWKAVCCHQSQISGAPHLERSSEQQHKMLWGHPTYYRAFSLVNGGRGVERDVFAGLRA